MGHVPAARQTIRISTPVKKGWVAKGVILVAGLAMLGVFAAALLTGYIASFLRNQDVGGSVFVVAFPGLGLSFVFAALYAGFTPQYLEVDEREVTYEHGRQRKHFAWKHVTKVRLLGVLHDTTAYAIVFQSSNRLMDAASDFDKEDLQRVAKYVREIQPLHGFELEDSD